MDCHTCLTGEHVAAYEQTGATAMWRCGACGDTWPREPGTTPGDSRRIARPDVLLRFTAGAADIRCAPLPAVRALAEDDADRVGAIGASAERCVHALAHALARAHGWGEDDFLARAVPLALRTLVARFRVEVAAPATIAYLEDLGLTVARPLDRARP